MAEQQHILVYLRAPKKMNPLRFQDWLRAKLRHCNKGGNFSHIVVDSVKTIETKQAVKTTPDDMLNYSEVPDPPQCGACREIMFYRPGDDVWYCKSCGRTIPYS